MIPGDFQLPKRNKKNLIFLIILSIVGLIGATVAITLLSFVLSAWFGLPLDVFGLNEGPDQPIKFPHKTHVEELGLDCTFCHRTVTSEASASVPSVTLCMTCHKSVGEALEEIEKLRSIYASKGTIDWIRVARVPDHAHFIHEAHVKHFSEKNNVEPAQTCSICHGNVAEMEKVRQARELKMGDCVDCHKKNDGPTDCTTCHY